MQTRSWFRAWRARASPQCGRRPLAWRRAGRTPGACARCARIGRPSWARGAPRQAHCRCAPSALSARRHTARRRECARKARGASRAAAGTSCRTGSEAGVGPWPSTSALAGSGSVQGMSCRRAPDAELKRALARLEWPVALPCQQPAWAFQHTPECQFETCLSSVCNLTRGRIEPAFETAAWFDTRRLA